MTRTKVTGQTNVGELRLAPLDVGFDLRLTNTPVVLPPAFATVGLEHDGEVYLVEGTRDELVAAIRAAGYRISGDAEQSDGGQTNTPGPPGK